MVPKHTSVVDAFRILNLDEDASLDEVKSAYKQLALKTHPDKNPDNEDATAQFQRIGDAYNVLQKHFDRGSRPSGGERGGSGPFGFSFYSEDGEYYDDDDDDDDDHYEDDDDMDFYRQEFLSNHFRRGGYTRQQYHGSHHPEFCHQCGTTHGSAPEVQESPEEYQARIRRAREEQEAATARRAQEEAARKAALEQEREREKKESEARQKNKAKAKKAQAEASRQSAKDTTRQLLQRTQTLRSAVFAAARQGEAAKVKKGVWEDAIDAAGGEIKRGGEEFVKNLPKDPQETLMHICVRKGDVELFEWLDTHSADPEERNKEGLTPFHLALQLGKMPIVKYFFDNHPPSDDYAGIYERPPSKSVINVALESREPEAVWAVLDKGLASKEDMEKAWSYVTSNTCKQSFVKALGAQKGPARLDEITNLLVTYGGFSRNKEPRETSHKTNGQSGSHDTSRSPTPAQTDNSDMVEVVVADADEDEDSGAEAKDVVGPRLLDIPKVVALLIFSWHALILDMYIMCSALL
ncbi:hypothetical protein EUX98_g7720 [Antrodiella citrinella]|uniref:J domain-containing protein n=1 Tax=Antrodiella citrinella TaxID=2447956 RepID=A0A4S4MN62_9APHY|nr:hypothetical protein EUX98_g7720 [Antrodiella citrinella]